MRFKKKWKFHEVNKTILIFVKKNKKHISDQNKEQNHKSTQIMFNIQNQQSNNKRPNYIKEARRKKKRNFNFNNS